MNTPESAVDGAIIEDNPKIGNTAFDDDTYLRNEDSTLHTVLKGRHLRKCPGVPEFNPAALK